MKKSMIDFITKIQTCLEYQKDSEGKTLKQERGLVPVLNEAVTRKKIGKLANQLLEQYDLESVKRIITDSVVFIKEQYVKSHDGFRRIKINDGFQLGVGDMYAISSAIAYLFDYLPLGENTTKPCVGIGVLYPARQDAGKNLIKLLWKANGHWVIDFGNKLKPKEIINLINEQQIDILALSCMDNKCLPNLKEVIMRMKSSNLEIQVIIGGIAVNKLIAYRLTQEFALKVYYGTDAGDAEATLGKAIIKRDVDVPIIKVQNTDINEDIVKLAEEENFKIAKVSIDEVIIDTDARDGCSKCSGDKKAICPLEIGFEQQKSLEESKSFIEKYDFAVIVRTDIPDEQDREFCKNLWLGLLRLEQQLERQYGEVFTFKLPMVCPFCPVTECRLSKGECMYPSYYRQLHEQYNINVPRTIENAYGDDLGAYLYAIILVSG